MEPVVFRKWSNKGYAVLCTFHRVIRIATLSIAYIIVQGQPLAAQSDTAAPRMFYELEEVETIGEQEADIYVSSLRQLLIISQNKLTPAPSRSLADVLDNYPGIDIRTRGVLGIQSDLSIQGGSFDQTQVLLNGLEITDVQTGHFSHDLPLHISAADRIEVLKGPSSKRYGPGAYAGAVNIVTLPSDSLEYNAGASYGSFNSYNTAATMHLPVGPLKNLLTLSSSKTDGYTDNTDAISREAYFHSSMVTGTLNSELFMGWNSKKFGALAFYTPRFPDQYEETSTLFAGLKLGSARRKHGISVSLHWRRHDDHFLLFRDNPTAYENFHQSDLLGVSIGRKFLSRFGVTNVHARYMHDRILSTSLGAETEETLAIRDSNREYDHFGSRNRFSLMTDHQVQYKKLYIGAGLLIQAGIGKLLDPGIYPGLDVSLELAPKIDLFASANRSMRLPTYTDLYYEGPQNRGNPDLKPEKAITIETGIKFSGEWYNANMALFYRRGTQTIDWIWKDSIWQTTNLTDLDTYGGEITILLTPPTDFTASKVLEYLRFSYAYTEINKSSESFISNYALDNLKHKAVIDIRLNLSNRLYMELTSTWQDRNGSFLFYETPSSTPYETAYDPFWLINLNTGIRLNRFTVFLNIKNITDAAYRDIGSVIMPGRWFMTGIRFGSKK